MDLFRQRLAKWSKENWLLLAIFLLGLFLRLLGLINIKLAGDNLLHWKIAGDIVTKGIFPLLGPRASLTGNFNLGPLYYYLLAIPYWLGRGDFRVDIIFFAVLNSLSIPLLYLTAKRWFSKEQSLKISLLFTVSAYFIQIQSFPWNPYILPFFIILCLYFINKTRQEKLHNFIFLTISYAICLQLHATTIFLLPVFLYLLPVRKIPAKYYLLALCVLLAVNFPWIWVNLTTNFSQIHAAILILTQGKVEQCSFVGWLANHGNGERCFWYFRNTLLAFRFLTVSLFGLNSIPLALISLFVIAYYFIRTKLKENRYLFVWFLIPLFLFLFYSNDIYLHYFLILTPVPFFLFVIFLSKIENLGKRWTIFANVVFVFVILMNLMQYFWSLQFIRG